MAAGAKVTAFDPEAAENMKEIFGDTVSFASDLYEALDGADALAIMTEWSMFRTPEFDTIKSKLSSPIIFDGRNLYDLEDMETEGFYYNSIGRNLVDGRA